jgi:hypothetical protein
MGKAMKTWIKGMALGLALTAASASADAIDNTCASCGRRLLDSLNFYNVHPIRVNQVGYKPDDTHKTAFYASTKSSPATTSFSVVRSDGVSVYDGTLVFLGNYSKLKAKMLIKGYYNSISPLYSFGDTTAQVGNEFLWKADFGALKDSGSYRIAVGKDTSLPFDIRETVYNDVFETALKFFGAQRCGNTDSWFHAACHTKDGSGVGHEGELQGGWHDCGDHGKYGETEGYAASMLALAYAAMPEKAEDRYGASYNDTLPFGNDGIPDLLNEAKVGADYIYRLYTVSKADGLIAKNDMYHSVGMGPGMDHLFWDVPEHQDAQVQGKGGPDRPVTAGIGSNVAGMYIVSLALVGRSWEPFDPDYSKKLIAAAEDIYANVMMKNLYKKTNEPCCYDGGGQQQDDPAFAAVALWYATGKANYGYDLYQNASLGNLNAGQSMYNIGEFATGLLGNGPITAGGKMTGGYFDHGGWTTDFQQDNQLALYAFGKLILKDTTTALKYGISSSMRDSLLLDVMTGLKRGISIGSNGSDNLSFPGINVDQPYHGVFTSAGWGFNRYNMGMVTELFLYWDLEQRTQFWKSLKPRVAAWEAAGKKDGGIYPGRLARPEVYSFIDAWTPSTDSLYLRVGIDNLNYQLGVNPWDLSFIMGAGSKNLQHPHNRAANPEGYNAGGVPYKYKVPKGALMGGCKPGSPLKDYWIDYTVTETCIDFSSQLVFPSQIMAKDLPPDTVGPVFKNVTVVQVSDTSAIIAWQTDELSKDTLFYSLLPNGPVVGYIVSPLAKNKTATVTGLTPKTTYYFWFKGMDIYRNVSYDDNRGRDYQFTTSTNSVVPKIYDIKVCNIRSDRATVFWWTDIVSTSSVEYALDGADFAKTKLLADGDDEGIPGRFHKVTLKNLKPGTAYRFDVISGSARDDSNGVHHVFATTQDFANYTIQMKATTKNYTTSGKGAHFYLLIANNESKPYAGLQLRLYFNADAATAQSLVVHSSDNGIFGGDGQMKGGAVHLTFGSAVAVGTTGNSWYVPITLQDTLPVSGSMRIELKMDNANWNPIPFSTFDGGWSFRPHTAPPDPKDFAGIDLTKPWAGPDQVEPGTDGFFVETYVDDPYITAWYNGVHIYGYPPDGTKPRVFRNTSFEFDKPLPTPATSVWQDTFAVHFLGSTWSAPDVVKADWQVDGPTLRTSTPLAARADSIQFMHDTGDAQGTTAHEFAFWGDRDSSYCSCAWQRYTVTVDTMKVPPRQLKLVWSQAGPVAGWTGSRQSLVVTLMDSVGVFDTSATISLSSLKAGVSFWTAATGGSAVSSLVLSHGSATVWFLDSSADTAALTASSVIPGSVVVPGTVVVNFANVPPRKLALSWDPAGPISAWSGTHRTSAIVTLSDSAGVFDTSATVALSANAAKVRFWDAASGGTQIASLVLVHGKATVWFSDSLADTAALMASASIAGSVTSPAVLSVGFQLPPPWPLADSAWTADSSCGGNPTSVLVRLSSKLSATVQSSAASAELSGTKVTFPSDSIRVLADSQTVLLGLPGGTISGTAVSGTVRVQLHVKDETRDTLVWDSAAVLDRVAPVLVKASVLEVADGQTQDTLYLKFSEPVKASDAPVVFPGLSSLKEASWDAVDTTNVLWRVVIDPQGSVPAGSSARASASVADLAGNAARECSPSIEVAQQWRPVPIASAAIYSSDSDGRADSVVVRFRRKMRTQDTIAGLLATWGTGTRKSTDTAASWQVATDSMSVTGRVSFAWGATSGDGDNRSGTVGVLTQGALVPEVATMADSVGPVLLGASLRYSAVDGIRDTLWLDFSEEVRAGDAVASRNREPSVLSGDILSVSGERIGLLLFADSLRLGTSDSLRAAPRSLGGVYDAGSVSNEMPWKLAPITFGKRPPVFLAVQKNSVVTFKNWDFGGLDPVRTLVHAGDDSAWSTLSGQKLSGEETARVLGISLTANECFDGFVVIYDNLGTYVASMDLTSLYKACQDKSIAFSASGRYQAWLAWDGRSVSREAAATGVYTLRLVTRRPGASGSGLDKVTNQLFRFGWKRKP